MTVYSGEYIEGLEARIRELEADVAAYIKDVDDMAKQRDLFEERIAKAEQILAESVKRECGTFETRYYYDEIKEALKALEGK